MKENGFRLLKRGIYCFQNWNPPGKIMERPINRREFLKKTVLTTAGVIVLPQIIPASVLGKDGKVAPSDRIVMATIGSGSMGTGDLRSLIKQPTVQYVAICDVDKKHRERAMDILNKNYGNNDARGYNDFRELLEKESLDAVNIALPDHWHAIITIARPSFR